jgi:hypothetical protein
MATPFPFTAGQVLTAAELNAIGEWIDYTPTWTNLTVGNGTQNFRYLQVNKCIFIMGTLTFGSTTSITGNNPTFTLPVTADTAAPAFFGSFTAADIGTENYHGLCLVASSTTAAGRVFGVTGTRIKSDAVTSTVPMTWTTNDRYDVQFFYEAA